MSSSWGKKLEKKLKGLADTASKESIQTLSNWIAFNRKHAQTIATVLTNALQDFKNNDKRQWLIWQLIHEVLLREKGNTLKWEKLGELRLALGEALQPSMKILGNTMPDQLKTYLEEWEDQDVFSGPSLNSQIQRLFQNRKNLATTAGNSNATKASAAATDNSSASSAAKPQEPSTPSTTSEQPTLEASKLPAEIAKASVIVGKTSGVGQKEQSTNDDNCDDTMHPGPNDNDDAAVAATEVQQQKIQQEMQSTSSVNSSEETHGKLPSPQKQNSTLKEQVQYDFESKVSVHQCAG
jgi:hypothetical protein